MEMEGSGGSQSQLTQPAVDVNEAALGVTKRERKRSRYLSPPYTDTGVQEKKAAGSRQQREEEEEEEGPPHVSASEVLSALRAAALGQGEGMDAAARFLAMYSRNRNSIFVDDSHAGGGSQDDGSDKPPSAAGVGRKMLNLNAGLDDGSLAKKKKNPNPKNPHPPAAVAVAAAGANAKQQKDGIMENAAPAVPEHAIATHGASQSADFAAAATHGHPNPPVVTTAIPPINNEKNPNPNNPHPPAAVADAGANAKQQKDDGTMENAAVPEHAITTHGASQSAGFAAATHGHPNPPVVTTATPPININNEKKRKMNKKRTMKTAGQHSYVGNPVALVLDFAEGTPLPSREDLLSTFSRFGFVIDSETTISQDKHTAQVAFATRVQAETALSCAATLGGAFGPPFAVASLQDLPPITLNTPPPPLPKLPLTDIRNNLGKMILSLSSKATAAPQEANAKTAVDSLSLVGDMQRLLAKVDKVLQVQGASATAHHA
ncbi:unnamed protein product [Miscanthus lutarioriparius]|uniref:Uncharacterized protein n=1 Tax=Miscanthus lutarioriparius TaxID=422564 RepID=A0A811RUI9_9POAL|nr:unnamed protein product [Miscanthus lutarioriparius]